MSQRVASLIPPDGAPMQAVTERFRWPVAAQFNIATAVCSRHADGSGRLALICESEHGGAPREVSFDQLEALANRLGNALRALGVARGDRVGIILPQRLETVLAHIAIYKLGAIALPLSRLFGHDALAFRLRDSGARCVISDAEHEPMLLELAADLPDLAHIISCNDSRPAARGDGPRDFDTLVEAASDQLQCVTTSANDPAQLIYTSGTTGQPKGAVNAHRCLVGNLPGFELSHNYFPMAGDRMYTPADWAWTGGLLDALLPGLYYGVPVIGDATQRFDPERMLHLLSRHAVSNAFIPPTALKMTMQVASIRERHALRLRTIMSGGEQVGPEIARFANETLGAPVNEIWGQTEANYLAGGSSVCLEPRPGALGKPYPGHRVEVLDEDGQRAGDEVVGQLAVHRDDPVMFLGYWQNPDATAAKTLGEWWLTGDQGYRDGDGYLWFVGRDDDVISTAGYRVGPGEVEDCLIQHAAVAQAAVIGVPDALRGQVIKAYVVLAAGHDASPELAHTLQTQVKQRLAAHEYPRQLEFIDALPMTTTGKVRRVELRQQHAMQATAQSGA